MSLAKSDLAKVRHDLRTPINHIMGYCELLLEEPDLPPEFREDLGRVRNGGRQLLGLINEYFDEAQFENKRRDLHQVHHDLRTPVNHIIGYSEILLEQAAELGLKRLIPDLRRIHEAARTWLTLAERHLLPGAGESSAAVPLPPTRQAMIPFPDPAAAAPGRVEPVRTADRADEGQLLVVDDDAANRLMLARRLRRQGYTARVAEGGRRALQCVRQGGFDLVLLDLVMPGMDGLEVLRRLRQEKSMSELPIIMVTGKDSSADVVEALKAGANDYVTKPVDFSVAMARVRTQLSLKRAQEQLAQRMEEIRQLAGNLQKRNDFIKQVFGRYVTDDVVQNLLDTPQGLDLGGQRRVVTILMSDLRGFTALAERLSPEQVVELLNVYLGVMAEIITRYHGLIDEFIGDAILAVFGATIHRGDNAEQAVACGLAMQLAMEEVNRRLRPLGVPELEMGIGVNTGEVIVGNIGSTKRAKYGVVGSNVNLAGRIQSASVGSEVLISESTAATLKDRLALGRIVTISPKGVRDPVTLYSVRGLAGTHNLDLPTRADELVVLAKEWPVQCFLLDDSKQVVGSRFAGGLTSVSPKSAVLRTPRALKEGADLKLQLASSADGPEVAEFYAKVLGVAVGNDQWTVRFTSTPPSAVLRLSEATGLPV